MSFFIPPRVRETASGLGAEGTRWLADLPARITELEQAWSLTAGRAFDTDGCVSWVAPVQLADGSEAVLKISIPHPEARREADALSVYEGRGAVRLLRVSEDGFSLLMERCVPGTNLWSLDVDEGNAAGAAVLRRLWREPPPAAVFDRLSDLAAEWCEALPREAPAAGYDAALVADAVALARELAQSQPQMVLLHGDFHPGNVLAAAREPWLAIDCKPLVGDPAYDLAQWLGNRCEVVERSPDAIAAIRRQIRQFSYLRLRNTGPVDGDEVPHVYLGAPQEPPSGAQFAVRALAAFDRVRIPAGQSKRIAMHVPPRQLQYWSTSTGHWATAAGRRTVVVAASSRDIRLQAEIDIAARSAALDSRTLFSLQHRLQ